MTGEAAPSFCQLHITLEACQVSRVKALRKGSESSIHLTQARVLKKTIVAAHILEKVLTVGRVPVPDREEWWHSAVYQSRMDGFLEKFVSELPESFKSLGRP